MTDTDSKAFEAWASNSPVNLAKHNDGMYASSVAAFAWRAYKAATQRQKSRIAELEAEVQALRKDAEWLPIETAPANTWILTFGDWQDPPVGISLYRNERRVIDRVEHESMNDKGRRRIVQEETVTDREWDGYHWEPTHWKPLPPAPSAAMNKEGARD